MSRKKDIEKSERGRRWGGFWGELPEPETSQRKVATEFLRKELPLPMRLGPRPRRSEK